VIFVGATINSDLISKFHIALHASNAALLMLTSQFRPNAVLTMLMPKFRPNAVKILLNFLPSMYNHKRDHALPLYFLHFQTLYHLFQLRLPEERGGTATEISEPKILLLASPSNKCTVSLSAPFPQLPLLSFSLSHSFLLQRVTTYEWARFSKEW
jgi:hypothetical protein